MERKEAIEVIKKNWPDSSFTMLREALETLVPELKESEDERIRKVLIDYFNGYKEQEECGIKTFNGTPTDNIIAWLEKQGETFTKKDVDDAYIKGICDAKHEFEKQGEQKPNYNNKELKDVVIAELSKYNSNDLNAPWATDSTGLQYPLYFANLGAKWQGEQKSDDKVEPKFKDLEDNVTWCKDKIFKRDIEYTRTDAFIEKADKFISSFFHPDDTELRNCLLKNFHEYMEGE